MISFLAFLIVFFDVVLLIRNRHNSFLVVFNFLILYFNYSICFGVYILKSVHVDSYLDFYKEGQLYHSALILLFVFTFIRFLFLYKKFPVRKVPKMRLSNLYYLSTLILLYIAVFEIDRNIAESYSVQVSPLYEYSYIFFMLALYFEPNEKKVEWLIYAIALLIIGQDFFYGGRVTSLQIILVFALMKFSKFITLRNIVIPFVFLNLIFTLVGVYRESYVLKISVADVFEKLLDKLFISDTAVYAYFASITHLLMFDMVTVSYMLESLGSFLALIFLGGTGASLGGVDLSKAYLTDEATKYHWNAGGGLIFSNFYFWFGPYLFPVVCTLFFIYVKRLFFVGSRWIYFSLIILVVTLPRWYLYSPLALFRSLLFMLPVIWIAYMIFSLLVHGKRKI